MVEKLILYDHKVLIAYCKKRCCTVGDALFIQMHIRILDP